MKALAFTTFVLLAVSIALLLVGSYFFVQVSQADVAHYITSTFVGCGRNGQECCPGDWCDVGLICSNSVCMENITTRIEIDESYLIYNETEAANRSQRTTYLFRKTGSGEEECSKRMNNCENCIKVNNFQNALTCMDCSSCDSTSTTCESCLSCDSAELGNYQQLSDCYECSNCINIDYGMADRCSQCAYCQGANITTYENGLTCESCNECGNNIGDRCYFCYECDPSVDKICDACYRTADTECEIESDYDLCKRVKECIADPTNEELCLIEELLPVPLEGGYFYNTTISNILTNCVEEDVYKQLDYGKQKICRYDNSNINFIQNSRSFVGPMNFLVSYFSSDDVTESYSDVVNMLSENHQYNGLTGENKGILFNDCGMETIESVASPPLSTEIIYSSDPVIFNSLTTPRTPAPENDIPINLEMRVTDVYWGDQTGNDCSYNVYLCQQEAIATSEVDNILNFYRTTAYFNETKYKFKTKKWNSMSGGFEVNVTGMKFYKTFIVDLDGRTADVAHIAKALIASLRDYAIMNSIFNLTVKLFCTNNQLYQDLDDCYNNSVSVYLNDNIPWKIESFDSSVDTLQNIPEYKYIYYYSGNPDYSGRVAVELTFFVYSSNITSIENKMFITPVVVIRPGTEFCGNNLRESSEQCDGTDDTLCDGQCDPATCMCPLMFFWVDGEWPATDFEETAHTYESPNCPSGTWAVSCGTQNYYPFVSDDKGRYGEDDISEIAAEDDYCYVTARDVLGGGEQRRKVDVLCTTREPIIKWPTEWDWIQDNSNDFHNSGSPQCDPGYFPVACYADVDETDTGYGSPWTDNVVKGIWLDSGIKTCNASFKDLTSDGFNLWNFRVKVGIGCMEYDFGPVYWGPYNTCGPDSTCGTCDVEKTDSYDCAVGAAGQPISCFPLADQNWNDDNLQSIWVEGDHCSIYTNDHSAEFPFNICEQRRQVGVLFNNTACKDACFGYMSDTDCPDAPACIFCPRCSGYKINQWGGSMCAPPGTDCGYECRSGFCDAPATCGVGESWDGTTCNCIDSGGPHV